MLRRVGNVVFDENFHAHLHGSLEDPVNGGTEDDEISDADGDQEIDVIDGSGDDVVAGVAVRGHGAG